MTYIERAHQQTIDQLLGVFPAVLVLGARQVGKTTLAKACRPGWRYFDLERGSDFDFITGDFDLFFREYPTEIIIDEAQESPQLFKELRGVIDHDRTRKNRFILTGSSSPEILSAASDSLAGRIGIIELGTLKLSEQARLPLSDFFQILSGPLSGESLRQLRKLDVRSECDFINHMLRGGYPEPASTLSDTGFQLWMENYHRTYIDRDVRKLFPRLDSIKYRRFVTMLANLSGTTINKAQLGRSIDTSEVAVRDYLEVAAQTFIWRNLPSYESSAIKSTVKMPKGLFRDSGLLNHLLKITNREQLIHSPLVGQHFESAVIEELIKGFEAADTNQSSCHYYRTRNGAEVDLIMEGSHGAVPIEIKFGSSTKIRQLTSLTRFIKDNHLPLGIVINNSQEIRMLSDQIIQIPVTSI
ncbi:MAG: DUF4143 domain-containing protein [Sedimenticola sp.]